MWFAPRRHQARFDQIDEATARGLADALRARAGGTFRAHAAAVVQPLAPHRTAKRGMGRILSLALGVDPPRLAHGWARVGQRHVYLHDVARRRGGEVARSYSNLTPSYPPAVLQRSTQTCSRRLRRSAVLTPKVCLRASHCDAAGGIRPSRLNEPCFPPPAESGWTVVRAYCVGSRIPTCRVNLGQIRNTCRVCRLERPGPLLEWGRLHEISAKSSGYFLRKRQCY